MKEFKYSLFILFLVFTLFINSGNRQNFTQENKMLDNMRIVEKIKDRYNATSTDVEKRQLNDGDYLDTKFIEIVMHLRTLEEPEKKELSVNDICDFCNNKSPNLSAEVKSFSYYYEIGMKGMYFNALREGNNIYKQKNEGMEFKNKQIEDYTADECFELEQWMIDNVDITNKNEDYRELLKLYGIINYDEEKRENYEFEFPDNTIQRRTMYKEIRAAIRGISIYCVIAIVIYLLWCIFKNNIIELKTIVGITLIYALLFCNIFNQQYFWAENIKMDYRDEYISLLNEMKVYSNFDNPRFKESKKIASDLVINIDRLNIITHVYNSKKSSKIKVTTEDILKLYSEKDSTKLKGKYKDFYSWYWKSGNKETEEFLELMRRGYYSYSKKNNGKEFNDKNILELTCEDYFMLEEWIIEEKEST